MNVADVKDHAAHAHDLVSANGKGTKACNVAANEFGNATADYTIAGGSAANGGVQTTAAMVHVQATAAGGGVELNKNNSAFTIYGTAIGFV
jgi:hypothetical protein